MSDFWRVQTLVVLLLGCDANQTEPVTISDYSNQIRFNDVEFGDTLECENGFGPLTLRLQPGQLPYEDMLHIYGCVKVEESNE